MLHGRVFVIAFQTMELKGQMIHLPESDEILFLGSPSVEKFDELIAKGLYISDLPIHDATRDVILVGEQTKAQVRPIVIYGSKNVRNYFKDTKQKLNGAQHDVKRCLLVITISTNTTQPIHMYKQDRCLITTRGN